MRAANAKAKAKKLLDHLSEDKAKVAVSFLEFLEEKECWEATKEILGDKELMAAIQRGKADVATPKTARLLNNWTRSLHGRNPLSNLLYGERDSRSLPKEPGNYR